jgi:hypothetical protein
MAAFWAVFTFGGSGPAITAHGSLDLKQEIQIQIQTKKSTTWSSQSDIQNGRLFCFNNNNNDNVRSQSCHFSS